MSKSKPVSVEQPLNFGERIARLRKARRLSMQKLAKAIDVSAAYICRLESGERHASRELTLKLLDHLLPDGSQVARDELLVAAGHAPVNFRNFMGRQDVISIYEDMLAKNPGDFKAFIALAIQLLRAGHHERARAMIHDGMQKFDDMSQLHALMAALELAKQNFEQAIAFQSQAIRYFQLAEEPEQLNLSHADLLLSMGVIYFEKGHLQAYEVQALQTQNPAKDLSDLKKQAVADLTQAQMAFNEALKEAPEDVYIQDELARVHFTIGYLQPEKQAKNHWQSSIDAFETTLCAEEKADLGYEPLLQSTLFLTLAYSKAGNFEQAWFLLNVVEACLPNYWLVHYMKACYFCLRYTQKERKTELLEKSLKALYKAAGVQDKNNRTVEEAKMDFDLTPLRDEHKDAFKAFLKKWG